jgi:hypothetical protein
VIVVDGSPPEVFDQHAARFADTALHVRTDPTLAMRNGKVAGVHTGIRHARGDRVVIADDDVRHTAATLRELAGDLRWADLVIPQNVFPIDAPWHARWDTARTLLQRLVGPDAPGTLAIRRSTFLAMGGYDGDVLFENLELIRTVAAAGGTIARRPDVYVTRLPPSTQRFFEQRVRQAYDEFARPLRLGAALLVVPSVLRSLRRGRGRGAIRAAIASVALAEVGRRRDGGTVPTDRGAARPGLDARARDHGMVGRDIARAARRLPLPRGHHPSGCDAASGLAPSPEGPAACEPSHSGFVRDRPQRHSGITARRVVTAEPSSSTSSTSPRTRYGPDR